MKRFQEGNDDSGPHSKPRCSDLQIAIATPIQIKMAVCMLTALRRALHGPTPAGIVALNYSSDYKWLVSTRLHADAHGNVARQTRENFQTQHPAIQ